MMKFEVPEYDFKKYGKLLVEQELQNREITRKQAYHISEELDYTNLYNISHKIGEEQQKQLQLIEEFEKKYPGFSLCINNNDEFVVINTLLMDTIDMIKLYRYNKKEKLALHTTDLKQLKENLNKILSDSKLVNNLSESTYEELSEINAEIREELEIRANYGDSPFKLFEKELKKTHNI